MSDDLAQQSDPPQATPETIPIDEPEPLPAAFVQLTEITATPQDAADAIERRDALGRIPVVVRIRREIAFDVPVSEVRSSDGVSVDLMLSLQVADPVKFAYSVSTGDADQLVHAAAQEAVRTMVRGIEAMSTLDLGDDQAAILREVIDTKLDAYGLDARSVSFTRVTLPPAFTSSLEARRLSVVQQAEQSEAYALERRRLADHASLISQEAEARRSAVEHEAAAEALRLAKMEERLAANPHAAQYDMEMSRIRIAQQLAGNSRAVVSLGASDLVGSLLVARESADANTAAAAGSDGSALTA